MSETPQENTPGFRMPEQPPTPTADGLKAAYTGWLERRNVDPAGIPHLRMRRQEFDEFRNTSVNDQHSIRERYGIPSEDQDNCQYAFVDIEPDDSNSSHSTELVTVKEEDFGTALDLDTINEDFQETDPTPDKPPTPDSRGALITVDIGSTLNTLMQDLPKFATELMRGVTEDPYPDEEGYGVRAGDVSPGQNDAYVWEISPFTSSVALTLSFPSQYTSVCVVHGRRREPANGKLGMAQIVNPTVELKIEGENLIELQRIYNYLYQQPGFALTAEQRRLRDVLFNDYLGELISDEAKKNKFEKDAMRRRSQQPPQQRSIRRTHDE